MKATKPFRRIFAILLALVLLFGAWPATMLAAEPDWTHSEDTEIFLVKTADTEKNYAGITRQIQLFASELAEKVTDASLPISYGDAGAAGSHDIILVLDGSLEIPAQGYSITATENSIQVCASDADGLFYGCRYVIQQLLINGAVTSAEAAPDVLERAVSLDNGRKYFSVDWIKEFIREMSWANMNALALHFSEEMGLGIESKLYPWLAGRDGTLGTQAEVADDDRYLTQAEIVEIVEYARLYHVEIIPSFDSPGHMNYVVKKFNEKCAEADYSFTYDGKTYTAEAGSEIGNYYHYNGKTAIVQGSRNKNYSRGIDISNAVAVAFTKSLIEEYAALFGDLGCTKFDIGGDELLGWGSAIVSTSTASRWQQLNHWKEYAIERTGDKNAVAYDAFLLYMNDLYDLVTDLGYTSVRMWNDDAMRSSDTGWKQVVQLNTNIDIWYWTASANNSKNSIWTYLNAGYQAYNILSNYNYYAMTSGYLAEDRTSYTKSYPDDIYNEWNPFVFDPNSTTLGAGKNPSFGNPNVLGSAIGVWCDNPELRTAAEVMEEVLPLVRAHGAKAWDATVNQSIPYSTYAANLEKLGGAPAGSVPTGSIYVVADLTALEAAVLEYSSYKASDYTAESFAAYQDAVATGKAVLDSDKPAQADVDAALAIIETQKAALRTADTVSTADCFLSGRFRSSKVQAGKTATLNLSVIPGSDLTGFEIYNDLNGTVEMIRTSKRATLSNRDSYVLMFRPSEAEVGTRTYIVYGIFSDGTRSADCLELTLTVK